MARKPNYGQQRSERNRAKQAAQEAKQKEKEEAVARRKAEKDGPRTEEPVPAGEGDPS